jgi:hypothetical protein
VSVNFKQQFNQKQKMKKWQIVKIDHPPIGENFWGYDDFSEAVCICSWDGVATNDKGDPFPSKKGTGDDDLHITYWMEMEKKPVAPNVKEY